MFTPGSFDFATQAAMENATLRFSVNNYIALKITTFGVLKLAEGDFWGQDVLTYVFQDSNTGSNVVWHVDTSAF